MKENLMDELAEPCVGSLYKLQENSKQICLPVVLGEKFSRPLKYMAEEKIYHIYNINNVFLGLNDFFVLASKSIVVDNEYQYYKILFKNKVYYLNCYSDIVLVSK